MMTKDKIVGAIAGILMGAGAAMMIDVFQTVRNAGKDEAATENNEEPAVEETTEE